MKKLLFIFVLGFLMLGFLGACTSKAESDGTLTIAILDVDGNALDSKVVNYFKGDTLVDVLNRSEMGFQYTEYSIGTMVTGVDGLELPSNAYLAFYVNNQGASFGVNDYEFNDEDLIEFRITTFE